MKKILSITFLLLVSLSAFSWGGVGHKAIAMIAEEYLTPATKAQITEYLDGKRISDIASDPDKHRREKEWFRDLGEEISNPKILWPGNDSATVFSTLESYGYQGTTRYEPWCHSFTVMGDDFSPIQYEIKDGLFVRNCVYELDMVARKLKESHKEMDAFTRYQYLALVVHLTGDMHCPMHTLYDPKAPTGGKNKIYIGEKSYGLHAFWDSKIFALTHKGWSPADYAKEADNLSKGKRKKITEGTVYDWARKSASKCWACQTYEGEIMAKRQKVSTDYALQMNDILFDQLRDGGYRLAALLNWIFE